MSQDRETHVFWVTGRRKAVARALALEAVRLQGEDWSKLSKAERQRIIGEADMVVGNWINNGVLSEFLYPYRE